MTAETRTPARLTRSDARTGIPPAPVRIVHLGAGAFHRAHQAWYTAHARDAVEWGIAAFTGRSDDVVRQLVPQDGLYTVIERGATADRFEVVDNIVEVRAAGEVERFLELVSAPTTAILSLTVTEAGYHFDENGGLDLSDPAIEQDAHSLRTGDYTALTTPIGRIVAGLETRRRSAAGPLAIMSCDNLPDNGNRLREAVSALAHRAGLNGPRDIASFVSTSVDRITPRTTPEDIDLVARATGWHDEACVVTEPFADWTISGEFPAGRPAWDATFVDDIAPFERRKLFVLNGGHLVLAFSGLALGHRTVAEAMADPECQRRLVAFWDEAARAVGPLDTTAYREALVERFENPRIAHQLRQIATDTATKLRLRVLPVLESERRAGLDGAASAAVVVAWLEAAASGAIAVSPDDLRDIAAVAGVVGTPYRERNTMKITSAEVIVTSPDRNFVTLKITTDDGLTGLGDATLNGRELAVVAYLSRARRAAADRARRAPHRRHLAVPLPQRLLAARPGHDGGDRRRRRGAVGHQGQGARTARSTSCSAAHPRPGSSPTATPPARTSDELFDSVRDHLEQGYQRHPHPDRRARAEVDLRHRLERHLEGNRGVRYDHEPAQRGALPVEEDWDTRAYLRHLPGVFEAVRNEFGPEIPLLHDGHHRMTPIQAAKLGKSLEPYDLFWLEDCTPAENQEALRLVRQHTTTPLAIGEIFNTVWDYQRLIREQLIDYVRSAVTHMGGITHLKKMLDYAGACTRSSRACTGPTDISPVGMAAAMHLGLAIHNFGIQEYMKHGAKTDEVFQQSFTWKDGLLHPGDQPGLGVELDVDEAGKYPYERAYLPYNRLADGTVHDW